MIQISDKVNCCGCNACGDVCGKNAITFKTDNEGFWYPEVDREKCVDCHLCEKVCPILQIDNLKKNDMEEPECYAAQCNNLESLFNSTSGSAFATMAEKMYKIGGYVGGAVFNKDYTVSQFISSDKPFNSAPGEDRADLLVLDSPVVVAESKNTGTAYDAITIFELKRPMRDDYNMEDNPITQLLDYAKKIKEDKAKDSRHRPIHASSTTQFYLYAVCDITPTLARVLERMAFTRTPDNLGAYFYNQELHAYIEVLSYDKIRNDSEKRNKVLFDKLGILN